MDGTTEDYNNICDNIIGKRWSPEAVHIAKREALEFLDNLAVLEEVPVGQCGLETNAKPIGKKWIDINKGDGDRVEIRSRLMATELKVDQVKMGILRVCVLCVCVGLCFGLDARPCLPACET